MGFKIFSIQILFCDAQIKKTGKTQLECFFSALISIYYLLSSICFCFWNSESSSSKVRPIKSERSLPSAKTMVPEVIVWCSMVFTICTKANVILLHLINPGNLIYTSDQCCLNLRGLDNTYSIFDGMPTFQQKDGSGKLFTFIFISLHITIASFALSSVSSSSCWAFLNLARLRA